MRPRRVWIKLTYASLLGLSLVILTGCWNAREIDELAFIMAIGVDRDESDGELIVSYRIANPTALGVGESGGSQGGGTLSNETTFTVMVKAKTIAEAMSRLRTQLPRRPFLSHLQGIIIGESLARSGVGEVLDYFEREEELRRSVHIFVTKDMSAAELFTRARQPLITSLGVAISGLLSQAPEAGYAPVVRVGDFLERLSSPRTETFAPALELSSTAMMGDSQLNQIVLRGTAVFRRDRLAGYLDDRETAILQMIRGGFRWTTLSVSAGEGVQADVRVTRVGGAVRVTDPANLRFRVTIQVRGTVKQVHSLGSIGGSVQIDRMSYELQTVLESLALELIESSRCGGPTSSISARSFTGGIPRFGSKKR